MLRVAVVLSLLSGAAAFVPSRSPGAKSTILMMSDGGDQKSDSTGVKKLAMNGWKFDEKKFCGGLPGAIAPLGNFDPFDFCNPVEQGESEVKRLREAEVMHGRVAMMAAVGILAGEGIQPLTGHDPFIPFALEGAASSYLDQLDFFRVGLLAAIIGAAEIRRAQIGWVDPAEALFTLRDDYYPGDIGFDELQMELKPTDPEKFADMQTRELSNGRLAMLAVAGMIAQELVNGQQIIENLFGFHRTLL